MFFFCWLILLNISTNKISTFLTVTQWALIFSDKNTSSGYCYLLFFFSFFSSSRFLSLNFGRVALHDSELKIILIYLLPDLCAHLTHFTSLYFTSTLLTGHSSQTEGWERLRLLAHRNYTNTHWPLYLRLLPSLTLTQPNCFSNHNQSLSNEPFSSPLRASSFCLETSVSVNNVTVFEESRQGKIYNKIKTWV